MRLRSALHFIQKVLGRASIKASGFPTSRSPALVPETNFQVLAENSGDILMEVGPDMRAVYVSPSCTRLLGWLPEELVGQTPDAFVAPEYLQTIAAAVALMRNGNNEGATLAFPVRRKDGGAVWMENSARLVRDPATGAPRNFIIIMRDISERKRFEQELHSLAMTDGLTGLANRRAFDEALSREWGRTVRSNGQISLLLLDVDQFKRFNDKYGHQVGDDCLRTIANAIRNALQRPADMAARYGGEELAVILPDTDGDGAIEMAERLRVAIERLGLPHLGNPEGGGRVTVSIGSATALSRSGGTINMPEGLLLAADTALYKAKHKGRNRIEATLLLAPEGSSAA